MWENIVERVGHRWQQGACALYAGYLRLQKHALRLCNIHRFSTTTMVARARLDDTLFVHCLSCSFWDLRFCPTYTKNYRVEFSFSSSWFGWTILSAYSTAKLESMAIKLLHVSGHSLYEMFQKNGYRFGFIFNCLSDTHDNIVLPSTLRIHRFLLLLMSQY